MWGTLPEVFDRVCLYYAESAAIRDHGRGITYRQMQQWANRVANGLGATGLAWRAILAGLGSPLPVSAVPPVFFVAQVGKYLPGAIWPYLEIGRAHV